MPSGRCAGWKTFVAARRAHVVLAPSAFSGRDIVRFTGVPEARVRVIDLGVREVEPSTAPRRPTVLFVGLLFQRRHIDVLVDAFARVAARFPDAHLDIVGENRTVPRVDYAAQVALLGLGRASACVTGWTTRRWRRGTRRRRPSPSSRNTKVSLTRSRRWPIGAVPVVLDTPVAR